ncbi:MAG: hypothetical protein KDB20_14485 [Microthrixaceae bacterium]|nr:hypothetical protein [Microthrixaceae bacterium]
MNALESTTGHSAASATYPIPEIPTAEFKSFITLCPAVRYQGACCTSGAQFCAPDVQHPFDLAPAAGITDKQSP